jgi:hypothetical protein
MFNEVLVNFDGIIHFDPFFSFESKFEESMTSCFGRAWLHKCLLRQSSTMAFPSKGF